MSIGALVAMSGIGRVTRHKSVLQQRNMCYNKKKGGCSVLQQRNMCYNKKKGGMFCVTTKEYVLQQKKRGVPDKRVSY